MMVIGWFLPAPVDLFSPDAPFTLDVAAPVVFTLAPLPSLNHVTREATPTTHGVTSAGTHVPLPAKPTNDKK